MFQLARVALLAASFAVSMAGCGGSIDEGAKPAQPSDTANPAIAFGLPADGATVAGAITVTGTASDDSGLAKVELRVDSGPYALAAGTSSWSYALGSLPSGSHTLTARATDQSGNTATANRAITVEAIGLVMPDASNTGPRYALTGTLKMSEVVPGQTYQRLCVINDLPQYGNMIETGEPATTFIDCELDGAIVYSPVHLDHCRIYGLAPYNSGGSAKFTHFRGEGFQGFRPAADPYGQMTSVPYVVEDSFIENTHGAGAGSGGHTEAMQSLAAADLTFRRTRFHQGGDFDGTITAVINHWGDDLLAEDVWITADQACAYYMLYSSGANTRWVRPRFSDVGMAVLYPDHHPTIVDPRWLDGTPITDL